MPGLLGSRQAFRRVWASPIEAGVDPEVAAAAVEGIVAHPDIHAALTEWSGFAGALSVSIDPLIGAAERAISLIDAELDA